MCSAITTKFINDIPKDGGILYGDSLYQYNYDADEEKIICVGKVKIEGNEEFINTLTGGKNGKTK